MRCVPKTDFDVSAAISLAETVEVVVLRSVDERRHDGRRERRVQSGEDHAGDQPRVDLSLLGDSCSRMNDAHLSRVMLERGDERTNSLCHARKRALARGLAIAVAEGSVERELRVARREEWKAHIGRRNAIEHHRAHMFSVLPEIDQRGSGPV